ncbi:MAG: precorrin-6y C5,15-methyltransferase (decarboxylating) subunit CbiE [Saccharospirillaceae bacterium]|nr:precorrin-6y C5,15-methyltransferase (decarboxylating) subunit CbiE [Pseudomonadales bacterium]NRB78065.1 precorrin-6y C5,15-methyltransferase (decarboxylating) subunit CbiE [Saccharospirillaceae bacterium]
MIYVLGLGVSEYPKFNSEIIELLETSDRIFGSPRQLKCIKSLIKHQRVEPLPKLKELKSQIDSFKNVVILASGDPLFYGIGKWLSNNFEPSNLTFFPGVSSLQACCSELGLSMQDCEVISLHGRPLNNLRKKLTPNQTLLILTDQYSHPKALAQECLNAGIDNATITVCEQLGYTGQRIKSFSIEALLEQNIEFDVLHVSVIQTQTLATPTIQVMPTFPGFPDELFISDALPGKGMLTKREVRLNILSLLSLQNGDVIWDVGAGCGSIAVELAYWNQQAKVIAIEHHTKRFDCLQANKQKFGVNNLSLINAKAPEAFDQLASPNKVFIGGSGGELDNILKQTWGLLPVGGVLVASAVTENTKSALLSFMTNTNCESQSVQIAISKAEPLANQLVYRPNLPVTLIKMIKTQSESGIENNE